MVFKKAAEGVWVRAVGMALSLALVAGCSSLPLLTSQDQEFLTEFTVMRSLENSSQPDVRAAQFYLAIDVVEGIVKPGQTVEMMRGEVYEWIDAQSWQPSDKRAARHVIDRVFDSAREQLQDLPLNPEHVHFIYRATGVVIRALEQSGYSREDVDLKLAI